MLHHGRENLRIIERDIEGVFCDHRTGRIPYQVVWKEYGLSEVLVGPGRRRCMYASWPIVVEVLEQREAKIAAELTPQMRHIDGDRIALDEIGSST